MDIKSLGLVPTADWSAQVPHRAGRAGLHVPVRPAPAAPPAGLQLRDPRLALQGLLPLQLPHRLSRLQVSTAQLHGNLGTVVNIRVYSQQNNI